MIPLGFLVLSTAFIITLIRSFMKLMNHNWEEHPFSANTILAIFLWPIISFIVFILFIIFMVPSQ